MPRDAWFYAVDNSEHGPVTSQDLKALAAAEKITPRTLVWQEGLPDWIPAEKVPGLFANASTGAAPAAPPVATPPASLPRSAAKWDTTTNPDDPPNKPPEPSPRPSEAPSRPAVTSRVAKPGPRLPAASAAELQKWAQRAGMLVFGVGLACMLMARGCDSLSLRYAARLQSLAQVTELQFRDDWDATRTDLESKRDEATKRSDAASVETYNERLAKLSTEKTAEQERLRRGSWRTLAQSARDAEANSKMWAFWREGLFVFGLILLTLGTVAGGFLRTGKVRWFFLVVLGGIILSLLGSAVSFRFGG